MPGRPINLFYRNGRIDLNSDGSVFYSIGPAPDLRFSASRISADRHEKALLKGGEMAITTVTVYTKGPDAVRIEAEYRKVYSDIPWDKPRIPGNLLA